MTRHAFTQAELAVTRGLADLMRALTEEYPIVSAMGGWRIYCCKPLLLGQGHIVGPCHQGGFENEWMYGTFAEAAEALLAWDGEGEPQGWTRHMPSGRR